MRIVFDIDGVFSNFVKAFNQCALKLNPGCLPSEDYVPDSWNYDKALTREQFDAAMAYFPTVEDFWLKLEPYRENQETIRHWISTSLHDLYFVTSRPETPGHSVTWQTRCWIENFLDFNPVHFSVVVAQTAYRKAQFARAVEAQFSIDDKPGNVRKLNVIEGHISYLLDRPYNQHADDLDEFRVKSVAEFCQKIVIDRRANR